MRRAAKIVAAVAVLAAMMGADNPGCGRNPVQSDRPASERRRPDPDVERTVQAVVTEATGPYTVTLTSHTIGGRGTDREEMHVAGGRWSEVMYYTTGAAIEVHLHVQGHAADTFACLLWDGAANRDTDRGKGVATCAIVTQQ